MAVSLPEFEINAKYFLDKSTLILAESSKGKSTIVQDILHCLSPHIDQIIVFCPTDKQHKSYETSIAPLPCIHYDISEQLLESINERQRALANVYKNANDINIIKNLFMKIPNIDNAKLIVHKIIEKEKQYRDELDDSKQIREITAESNKLLEKIYKQYINDNKDLLLSMKLTKEEQHTVNYINLNPRIVLVFDDCTELIDKIKRASVVKQLFYTGRWQFITFIIAAHNDKVLLPELKKSAFVTIFASVESAQAYFDRPSNNFTKEARLQAHAYLKIAFSDPKSYQKLLWIRDERTYYRYTASLHPNFRFGSEHIWKYCKAIENDNKSMSMSNNKFINLF